MLAVITIIICDRRNIILSSGNSVKVETAWPMILLLLLCPGGQGAITIHLHSFQLYKSPQEDSLAGCRGTTEAENKPTAALGLKEVKQEAGGGGGYKPGDIQGSFWEPCVKQGEWALPP